MNVIWGKWVLQILPEVVRTTLVYTLCMILISPVRRLYSEFMDWKVRQRIKAGGSPQVCMLQKIVKDSLGIDIVIEEGNGKPVDFIIKTAFTDVDKEKQLFALLDRYKLAGKAYGYENAEISITSQWMGYVCEQAEITSELAGFVCECRERIYNTITMEFVYQIYYGFEYLRVSSSYPLNSEIEATIYINYQGEYIESDVVYLSSNIDESVVYSGLVVGSYNSKLDVKLNTTEDKVYIYNVNIIKTMIK